MLLLQMYTRKEFVERNSCDVYMYVLLHALLHPFYTPFTKNYTFVLYIHSYILYMCHTQILTGM